MIDNSPSMAPKQAELRARFPISSRCSTQRQPEQPRRTTTSAWSPPTSAPARFSLGGGQCHARRRRRQAAGARRGAPTRAASRPPAASTSSTTTSCSSTSNLPGGPGSGHHLQLHGVGGRPGLRLRASARVGLSARCTTRRRRTPASCATTRCWWSSSSPTRTTARRPPTPISSIRRRRRSTARCSRTAARSSASRAARRRRRCRYGSSPGPLDRLRAAPPRRHRPRQAVRRDPLHRLLPQPRSAGGVKADPERRDPGRDRRARSRCRPCWPTPIPAARPLSCRARGPIGGRPARWCCSTRASRRQNPRSSAIRRCASTRWWRTTRRASARSICDDSYQPAMQSLGARSIVVPERQRLPAGPARATRRSARLPRLRRRDQGRRHAHGAPMPLVRRSAAGAMPCWCIDSLASAARRSTIPATDDRAAPAAHRRARLRRRRHQHPRALRAA